MSEQRQRDAAELHSAQYFGRERDFWWNPDFLELMATRWRLADTHSLADIGCGIGHWSRLLFPHLATDARISCIDREPRWIPRAEAAFRQQFPSASPDAFMGITADATDLPLPADHFDVVTCQTLLMHLPDPIAAIREMIRIARPGGLVIAVEPNNFFNRLAFNSLTWDRSDDELSRRFRFWLCYHRGKIRNGEGNDTIGELLPGYFAKLELAEIQVYSSDKAAAIYPPYNTDEQAILLAQQQQWRENESGPWDLSTLRRHVLAGGGTPALFDEVVAELRRAAQDEEVALQKGEFVAGNGSLQYLVSGRKPPQR